MYRAEGFGLISSKDEDVGVIDGLVKIFVTFSFGFSEALEMALSVSH